MDHSYWLKFWNNSAILDSENLQLQIGRSINRVPISFELWESILNFIQKSIELTSNDRILDFCAGNGLISIPFSSKCKSVTALDISERLLLNISNQAIPNINVINADANNVSFEFGSFTKIVFYFAIQHFSDMQMVSLLKKMYNWLSADGILYIGDIPDINKLFIFFDDDTRKKDYFESLENNTPIIGTWFSRSFIVELAAYVGFSKIEVIEQPVDFINSHYRFDLLLRK